MKVIRIIKVIEKYEALKTKLYKDKMELENYRTLEPDEAKEKIYIKKVKYDYDQLGKFLNMEV